MDEDDLCCPSLLCLDCGDTDAHKHLICGYSTTVISIGTVKDICLDDFSLCVNNKD